VATFTLKGEIPTRLVEQFLQVVRAFEQRDPQQIHLAMVFDVPELSAKEVEIMFEHLEIEAGFPLRAWFYPEKPH
jgi:hypothetical protein